MKNASGENGLEELLRLSQEIGDRGKELASGLGRARQSIDRVEKKRALWSVIREYKISMVMEQLEPLATFEISKEINSLKHKRSTAGLRQIITRLVEEIQKGLDADDDTQIDVPELKKKLKLLSILLELIFYID